MLVGQLPDIVFTLSPDRDPEIKGAVEGTAMEGTRHTYQLQVVRGLMMQVHKSVENDHDSDMRVWNEWRRAGRGLGARHRRAGWARWVIFWAAFIVATGVWIYVRGNAG